MTTTTKKTDLNLKAKAALAAATALAAGSLMLGALASPAHAAQTYTVNTGGVFAGTGGCNAIQCTLNEAILEANANPGADTINFNIPDSGTNTDQEQ